MMFQDTTDTLETGDVATLVQTAIGHLTPFLFSALGDFPVSIRCRVWGATDDYFPVKWALAKTVKERFDAVRVGIPFPTRTVIMEKGAA